MPGTDSEYTIMRSGLTSLEKLTALICGNAGPRVESATCHSDGSLCARIESSGRAAMVWFTRADTNKECFVRTPRLNVSYLYPGDIPNPPRAMEDWLSELLNSLAKRLKKTTFKSLEAILRDDPTTIVEGTPRGEEARLANETSAARTHAGRFRDCWGEADAWRSFFLDEIGKDDMENAIRVNAQAFEIRHGDLECMHNTPTTRYAQTCFFNYPWAEQPAEQAGRRNPCERSQDMRFSSDLNDADVISGGLEKLRPVLDAAVEDTRCDMIRLSATCVTAVIGDDVESLLREFRERARVPIIYDDQMRESPLDQFVGMINFKEGAAAPRAAAPRNSVNLTGFRPGLSRDELIRLLESAGVKVNVCLLPDISPAAVDGYLDARTQVFSPGAAAGELYMRVFARLPLRAVSPPAPYGPRRTWEWLKAVSEAAGRGAAFRKFHEANEGEYAQRWESARAAADGMRLGLVLDGSTLNRLTDPAQAWGIPSAPLLEEMGFGVDVLIYTPPGDTASAAAARKSMESVFTDPPRHALRCFRDENELGGIFREGGFQAVYSDIFFDRRLTRNGLARFSLDFFEMGFEGGLRAAERLRAVCRLPFYRRYGRYLGEAAR